MVSPCTTIEKPTTAKVTTTISSRKGSVDGSESARARPSAPRTPTQALQSNQVALCSLGCPVRFRLTAGQAGDAPQAAPLMDGLPAKVVMATRLMAHNA